MNILLIGSGGREHALAASLFNSPSNPKLFALPGNPGINQIAKFVPIGMNDYINIIEFCKSENIDLVPLWVVGLKLFLSNNAMIA